MTGGSRDSSLDGRRIVTGPKPDLIVVRFENQSGESPQEIPDRGCGTAEVVGYANPDAVLPSHHDGQWVGRIVARGAALNEERSDPHALPEADRYVDAVLAVLEAGPCGGRGEHRHIESSGERRRAARVIAVLVGEHD